ncbi:hypothetical protein QWQ09_003252 [Salmonella enterica]|nr:hypothetical protein [Salmonella enterica]
MIDIRSELYPREKQFISLYSFLQEICKQTEEPIYTVIKWVLLRIKKTENSYQLDVYDLHKLVSEFIFPSIIEGSPKILIDKLNYIEKNIFDVNQLVEYDDSFSCGLKKEDVRKIFPEIVLDNDDLVSVNKKYVASTLHDEHINNKIDSQKNNIQWEPKFDGRKTALEIIAAQALLIKKISGKKYLYGENISKRALSDELVTLLGKGNPDSFRRLISDALKENGFTDSE